MNVINFNEKTCERIRRYFDSYLDNELLVETNHEVLRHLASCAHCSEVLETRARLKHAVQQAVQKEEAPAVLLESILKTVREGGRRSFFGSDLARWATAAAAALILIAGSITALRTSIFTPVVTTSRDAFQLISAQAQEIMRIGLVDHVHCALLLEKWKQFISFEHMQEATGRQALGNEFIGLVPLVKEKLGSRLQVVQGHRCTANHRQYVHVILSGENGAILSLVITEKNGESLTRSDLTATLEASGVPVYTAYQGPLQVAAFETGRYLTYVVSNLNRDANLKAASNLAPSVYEYLRHLEA